MDFLVQLIDTRDFPARWHCGNWSQVHGWVHVVSDLAIFGAYAAIPLVLIYFLVHRRDMVFPRVFWLFGLFIFACGTGHLIEASIFWNPWYRLAGLIKVLTAVVSWMTVVALFRIVPQVLKLPDLAVTNESLRSEIQRRKVVEEQLRENSRSLDLVNQDLERFNGVMVGREDRILELKTEVNQLLEQLDQPPRYESSREVTS